MPSRPAIPRKIEATPTTEQLRARADELAADILAFLGEDEARILRFFDLTGLTPQSLRRAAQRDDFSTSLVEYLAGDDRLLLAFASARGRDPAEIEALRLRLAGPGPDAD